LLGLVAGAVVPAEARNVDVEARRWCLRRPIGVLAAREGEVEHVATVRVDLGEYATVRKVEAPSNDAVPVRILAVVAHAGA
jgi:hypothetical protein